MKHKWPSARRFIEFVLLAQLFCVLLNFNALGSTKRIVLPPHAPLGESGAADAYAKQTARKDFLHKRFLADAGISMALPRPEPRIIERPAKARQGYSIQPFALETFPGFFVRATLYAPAGSSANRGRPVILSPHGTWLFSRFEAAVQIRCANLARMGAYCISYSQIGFGEAPQSHHGVLGGLGLQAWTASRLIDYALTLPGADIDRIGIVGASSGGLQAIYAALYDARIAAVVPALIVYPFTGEGSFTDVGLSMFQDGTADLAELAGAIAPRPMLVIAIGKGDPTEVYPAQVHPALSETYARLGHPDNLDALYFPDLPHYDSAPIRREFYRFFAERFGMNEPKGEETGVEAWRALAVFNGIGDLPSDAHYGTRSVGQAWTNFRLHSQGDGNETHIEASHPQIEPRSRFDKIGLDSLVQRYPSLAPLVACAKTDNGKDDWSGLDGLNRFRGTEKVPEYLTCAFSSNDPQSVGDAALTAIKKCGAGCFRKIAPEKLFGVNMVAAYSNLLGCLNGPGQKNERCGLATRFAHLGHSSSPGHPGPLAIMALAKRAKGELVRSIELEYQAFWRQPDSLLRTERLGRIILENGWDPNAGVMTLLQWRLSTARSAERARLDSLLTLKNARKSLRAICNQPEKFLAGDPNRILSKTFYVSALPERLARISSEDVENYCIASTPHGLLPECSTPSGSVSRETCSRRSRSW